MLSHVLALLALACCAHAVHSNNWAVLVGASRYWFNYRHLANTLSIYNTVKKHGIPDSQIILFLADDMGCNARNPFAGTVFNNERHTLNLYDEDIEVDYRGQDATVENFVRLLTGRHSPDTPLSKRLLTDEHSNILVYLTGHGGDEFLKFQDAEELSSNDLADAFHQMREQRRYNEILFMIDTCQAATMHNQFYSPGIVSIGSSRLGENSYSSGNDEAVGVSLIDRFTAATLDFFQTKMRPHSTLHDLFSSYVPSELFSRPDWRTDLFTRSIAQTRLLDFFGSVNFIQPVALSYGFNASAASAPTKRGTTTPLASHDASASFSIVASDVGATTTSMDAIEPVLGLPLHARLAVGGVVALVFAIVFACE